MDMAGTGLRIGIDVGGTFTDFVLLDDRSGSVILGKELTSHDDPSRAILAGMEKLLNARDLRFSDLSSVVHATTLVTNAIIERKGARVGFVTTRGFRDAIEIGNEMRYELYDLFLQKPAPLVPRPLRVEVSERVDAAGGIVVPLAVEDVVAAAGVLRDRQVDAIAVCLLHSYRNPVHERQIREILQAELPGIPVTLSSDVAPEIREYERGNTASANAYVQPLVTRYLAELQAQLEARGFEGAIHLMLSAGGLTTLASAQARPIHLIESGPAAGAIAAGWFSASSGSADVLSFDMGGTTAKMCLLKNGEPQRSMEFEAGRVHRFRKGSGLPLKVPVIDLIEIGAGGGSIAHLNAMGLLKIGPESAGSEPGPVCYGRGGTRPTVTDADLVLGYLSPDYFLGGEMHLDLSAVHGAIEREIAAPLGMSVLAAAAGIHEVVNETMASATRMYLAEKGVDPRRHTLLAFGGAGPVHAYGLARLLRIPRMVVPPGAGVMSALGLLVAAPAIHLARGYISRIAAVDWSIVDALFGAMEWEARSIMEQAGASWSDVEIRRFADMRFIGQGFEIPSPIPAGGLSPGSRSEIEASFTAAYEQRFGRRITDIGLEALTWRIQVSAPSRSTRLRFPESPPGQSAEKGVRAVYFPGPGFRECAVFDRNRLLPGTRLVGPAVVEERESTTVIGPKSELVVDDALNLVVSVNSDTSIGEAAMSAA
ncbi:hydantoinase/oxoprolinase family protein [Labrys wisconsinensis]|uniref:N-methylhydantoinase A n=1 Tax=Labrys wisconsinensis TaxID=425677 RepID=A0ABU0JPY5_9HYPH|nr:hydantoinase/oxoprolinase family protein [Labrys wisconsinensis]MDQ0475438.1 N-methylhydantoinase A [Labrys wisconsinensis]